MMMKVFGKIGFSNMTGINEAQINTACFQNSFFTLVFTGKESFQLEMIF